MGVIVNNTLIPDFEVTTLHGPVVLVPTNATRVLVYSHPARSFTVGQIEFAHFYEEFIMLPDGAWTPLHPHQHDSRRVRSEARRPVPVPRAAYSRLQEMLSAVVAAWAADHPTILDQAQGRWLRSQLDQARRRAAHFERQRQEALAQARAFQADLHRRHSPWLGRRRS